MGGSGAVRGSGAVCGSGAVGGSDVLWAEGGMDHKEADMLILFS